MPQRPYLASAPAAPQAAPAEPPFGSQPSRAALAEPQAQPPSVRDVVASTCARGMSPRRSSAVHINPGLMIGFGEPGTGSMTAAPPTISLPAPRTLVGSVSCGLPPGPTVDLFAGQGGSAPDVSQMSRCARPSIAVVKQGSGNAQVTLPLQSRSSFPPASTHVQTPQSCPARFTCSGALCGNATQGQSTTSAGSSAIHAVSPASLMSARTSTASALPQTAAYHSATGFQRNLFAALSGGLGSPSCAAWSGYGPPAATMPQQRGPDGGGFTSSRTFNLPH